MGFRLVAYGDVLQKAVTFVCTRLQKREPHTGAQGGTHHLCSFPS